jgi:hypothetical protein
VKWVSWACGDNTKEGGVCVKVCKTNGAALRVISLGDAEHTLDTNVNVVLLTLLDLAGIFIRFRERVESFEILD